MQESKAKKANNHYRCFIAPLPSHHRCRASFPFSIFFLLYSVLFFFFSVRFSLTRQLNVIQFNAHVETVILMCVCARARLLQTQQWISKSQKLNHFKEQFTAFWTFPNVSVQCSKRESNFPVKTEEISWWLKKKAFASFFCLTLNILSLVVTFSRHPFVFAFVFVFVRYDSVERC